MRRCGDAVVDPEESCDDGDTLQNDCPEGEGPCTRCVEGCVFGPGVQVPAPKRWDGEAGDGRWANAANWSPDGVPTSREWVVIGPGTDVSAEQARCRHLTIEVGATLSQNERGLGCSLQVDGTFNASTRGLIPGSQTLTLAGTLGARTPWIDSRNTSYTFVDGALLANAGLALRIRTGNRMRFILSEGGFTTIRGGALLEPNSWADVPLTVDLSRYELARGDRLTLMAFNRHDGAFLTRKRSLRGASMSEDSLRAAFSGMRIVPNSSSGSARAHLPRRFR